MKQSTEQGTMSDVIVRLVHRETVNFHCRLWGGKKMFTMLPVYLWGNLLNSVICRHVRLMWVECSILCL